MQSSTRLAQRASSIAAYVLAVAAPIAFSAVILAVRGWPKPYSWQFLGVTVALAVLTGVGPGLVALLVSFAAVIWLRVPTPVHPGAEMFLAIGLCLLALLQRWRMTEAELKTQAAALRDANEQLRDANHRKNEFIAVLSHELRNPLAPIRYAVPLLEQMRPNGPAARALDVIRRQVDHLTRLVDDLLDVSRIAHGTIELRRAHVSLRAILTEAAEAASPVMSASRHQFDVTLPDERVWVDADAGRLAQVIINLLNNAAKFTQRGGRIELSAVREDGHAVIRVRDNGMGIPPEMLSSVFDMFRQLDRTEDSRHQSGLGIGLGLAKRLVELHGGTIEAHSAGPDHGAEFLVRVPLAQDPIARIGEHPAVPANGARRLKVLVVDDNADLVEMLATIVEWEGHEVRKALDGRSAIAAALAFRPDVILLDLGLPLVGGIDVARELRRQPELASMHLVALTGWGQLEDRIRTTEAGFDHHLTKPTDPETLTVLLREYARADRNTRAASLEPREM